jgi:MFS family permease
MTDAAAVEAGKIDIGRVIQETFQVIGRNFTSFTILSAVLVGLPTVLMTGLQGQMGAQDFRFGPGLFLSWLVAIVTSAILQGALVYGTVQDMNGRRSGVGDILTTGLRAFLPVIGVSLLFGIALVVGFILLIVPGIMIACAWCVAVPALVAERVGVSDAFRRSADLTRGNRWRLFGLLVIWAVAVMLLSGIIGAVTGAGALTAGGVFSPVALVLNFIYATLSGLVGATGVAVLYVDLRRVREGLGPQGLAEVFG